MILMWLGPFILAVYWLRRFAISTSMALSGLQKRFLALPESAPKVKTMLTTKLCGVSVGSFVRTQYSAVALLNSRAFSRSHALLLLCLSSAGTWATMLVILLSWQFEPLLLLLPWLAGAIYEMWRKRTLAWYRPFGDFALVLIAMRWVLRNQSVLMTTLGESDLHFLLADGRFPAQLLWLAVAFAVTLLIGIESWAVILALVLVVAGSLSLNGAVALIIGEMLGHVWLLLWRSRKLNQDVREITKSYAVVSSVGLVVAFFVAGLLRDAFAWSFTFEGSQLTEKSLQFFSLYFAIVVVQALVVLAWGHFAAQKKVDEVQKGEYFPISWITFMLLSKEILDFILKKIATRLDLLLAQKKELDSKDRAQIPTAFLAEHENEITQLALWLPKALEESQNEKRI